MRRTSLSTGSSSGSCSIYLCALALVVLGAVGCKQSNGERCEVARDCESNFCSINAGNPQNGTCCDITSPNCGDMMTSAVDSGGVTVDTGTSSSLDGPTADVSPDATADVVADGGAHPAPDAGVADAASDAPVNHPADAATDVAVTSDVAIDRPIDVAPDLAPDLPSAPDVGSDLLMSEAGPDLLSDAASSDAGTD